MARTMIHENNLAKHFWEETVNTTCYVQNRIYIKPILEKTTYELFKGRRPNISYFHQFGCTCHILNNKLNLKKFDAKPQRGIFVGYFERSKAYRVYNSKTLCVEQSMDVKFDDKEPGNETPEQDESFADIQVSEDTPEPDQIAEYEEIPETESHQKLKMKQLLMKLKMKQLLMKLKIVLSKLTNPRILSNTSHHIMRIKSLETKKVLEEQDHISDKKSL